MLVTSLHVDDETGVAVGFGSHTYILTYLHTNLHCYILTCLHAYILSYLRTFLALALALACACMHAIMHACIHMFRQADETERQAGSRQAAGKYFKLTDPSIRRYPHAMQPPTEASPPPPPLPSKSTPRGSLKRLHHPKFSLEQLQS